MMKTNAKNNSLTKKVLFSLVAAGMLSSFALSAEAGLKPIIIDNGGQDIQKNVDADYVDVSKGALTLDGGRVSGYIIENVASNDEDYPNRKVQKAQVAAYVNGSGSKLTANNVAFTGEIAARDSAKISITGGSITAGRYDYIPDSGKPEYEDNATNVLAYNKGKIELDKVDIKSNISAYSGGVINVTDSNVDAAKEILANGQASVINFNATDATKKYTIDVGEIEAENGAKITINNAKVNINENKHQYGLIQATGANSQVELKNSTITAYGLNAESNGKLTLAESSTATVDYIAAELGGTLEIKGNVKANSVTANREGKIYFTGGANTVYEVDDYFSVNNGTLYIYGGTLQSNKLRYLDTNDSRDRVILDQKGVISTISGNIYQHEASATEQDAGYITNRGLVFDGGELVLNDAQYTLAYA